MKEKEKIVQKLTAIAIIFILLMSQFAIIGDVAISYAIDMLATSSDNVQFSAYFKEESEEVTSITKSIDSKDLKLYIDVAVKNEGYFNGQISFNDAGFKIDENTKNEYIEKIENGVIYLKTINAEEMAKLEINISYFDNQEINPNTLNCETKVNLEGKYYSSEGDTVTNGQAKVKVKWIAPEETKAEIDGKLNTNAIYKLGEENKRIVQLLVSSKLTDNKYPISSTEIQLDIPENAQNIEVHKRTTNGTNGNKEFTSDNYKQENGKLLIKINNIEQDGKIAWKKNTQDVFVVTYEFTEDIDLSNTKIGISNKITTYETNETGEKKILNGTPIEISLNETIDGIVSIDQIEKEQEIYKGKIYTGEAREYTSFAKLYVDYADGLRSLNIKEDEPIYLLEQIREENTHEIIEKEANIQYKSIKLSKSNIEKVLGTEWQLNITDQNNNVKTISNESTTDETKKITIEDDTILVYLENGAKSINITTSKTQNNGIINIETTKEILEDEYTREEKNKFVGIKDKITAEYTKQNTEKNTSQKENIISLKETETKATLKTEQTALRASEEEQRLQFTIELDTSNESKDLYKNPEFNIILPKQIKEINAQAKILYGNGLVINDDGLTIEQKDEHFCIKIKPTGEQLKYPNEAESKGLILINSIVKLSKAEEDANEKIEFSFTNENATKYESDGRQDININILKITPEQESLNLNIKAEVGGEEIKQGDIINAGEIIKYTVTLENNGIEKVNGLELITTVPENTKLIERHPKYPKVVNPSNNTLSTDEEVTYFIEKDERFKKADNIEIEAGKKISYTYMVKVDKEINTEKNIQVEATVKQNDAEVERVLRTDKAYPSTLQVLIEPTLRTGEETLKQGLEYEYNIIVENLSEVEQQDIEVTISKSEQIDSTLLLVSAESNIEILDPKNNTLIIHKIPAKGSVSISLRANIVLKNEIQERAEIVVRAKDANSHIYRSNYLCENIEGIKINATINAEFNSENQYLKPGDEINYIIKLKNIGDLNADNLHIVDRFSNFLELESVNKNGETCDYVKSFDSGENVEYMNIHIDTNLNVNEEIVLSIKGKVKEINNLEDPLKSATNKVLVYNNDYRLIAQTEQYEKGIDFTKKIEPTEEEQDKENEEPKGENEEPKQESEEPKGENEEPKGENEEPKEENKDEENTETEDNKEDKKEDETENTTTQKYSISGICWLDENRNGARDLAEKPLEGTKVYIIDAATNQILKDMNGKEIAPITESDGKYTIENLEKGNYILMFQYDAGKYELTEYQTNGVNEEYNSDVIKANKSINNEEKTVAVTDIISLNDIISNIDIGLVELKTFDLELKKAIRKVTVSNSQGTKTYNFNDVDLAKVEIKSKYLNGSNVAIEYILKVTNTGDIDAYVKNIVDYLPTSLQFNSNMNKDWYQKDNYIYNSSLENTKIKPGETKEIKLILTKVMTNTNTGLVNNRAEIALAYNNYNLQDVDSIPNNNASNEDDIDSADIIISISTGRQAIYISICLIIITIITGFVYLIDKKRKEH